MRIKLFHMTILFGHKGGHIFLNRVKGIQFFSSVLPQNHSNFLHNSKETHWGNLSTKEDSVREIIRSWIVKTHILGSRGRTLISSVLPQNHSNFLHNSKETHWGNLSTRGDDVGVKIRPWFKIRWKPHFFKGASVLFISSSSKPLKLLAQPKGNTLGKLINRWEGLLCPQSTVIQDSVTILESGRRGNPKLSQDSIRSQLCVAERCSMIFVSSTVSRL